MPTSHVGNEPEETSLQGRCLTCGVIALGPRRIVLDQATSHFITEHPAHRLVLEGPDFVIEVAPYRCDLCGAVAEPPWWTYVTVPALTQYGDEDGRWLVCDRCHPLVELENINGLIERAVHEQRLQSPGLSRKQIRSEVKPRYQLFLLRAQPGAVRDSNTR